MLNVMLRLLRVSQVYILIYLHYLHKVEGLHLNLSIFGPEFNTQSP